MNIVQFLDEVGHTRLRFQYLHECLGGVKSLGRRKPGAVEVRFGTKEMAVSDALDPKRVAVIVWMDREDFDRAQEAATAAHKAAQ